MFEPGDSPRLFALPTGVDFARELVSGLIARTADQPPEALARVTLYVNTRRMQRRIAELFDDGPARLLPRIRLITDLARDVAMADIPPPVPPLQRRLELAQLVRKLIDAAPDLAPPTASFDLADSLAALMDEMQGEGVTPEVLERLDVSDQSGHWQRSLRFLGLITPYFDDAAPDAEARQRLVVDRLSTLWRDTPPRDPVIVAGSTASRGTTKRFMEVVARLPQGALVLPGFDFDQPGAVWDSMDDALTAEDHPQFRFARLLQGLGATHGDVKPWADTPPPSPERNQLVSLALRPAPVTDQWMRDGPALTGVDKATAGITLVEAPSARDEAITIALRLRQAVERSEVAALVTPDRLLTRQVTAALDRWGVEPDDSAGRPLPLSAPGRFLRHIAALFGQRLSGEALLTLLKHPLTNTGSDARGDHLRWTRELELDLRRNGPAFPTGADLREWAEGSDDGRSDWVAWLSGLIDGLPDVGTRTLSDHLDDHLRVSVSLSSGPSGEPGGLWDKQAGREALKWMSALSEAAGAGGAMSPAEYAALVMSVLGRGEVRDPVRPHPNIMIWGTMEARVQGADLVILGGLNDGIWPAQATPDPWLNRELRKAAGLLLPERRIGLSAHDFQQAVAAREVWLTRAVRDAESETVPSRWLNRITNLLDGLAAQDGPAALKAMRARGKNWLETARQAEMPEAEKGSVPAEKRPSPRPPTAQRPRRLSVTRIKTLIRDPYAIYAQYVLGLRSLDPIRPSPDAPLRGTILHDVLERFLREGGQTRDDLMRFAAEELDQQAPWPAARRVWLAKFGKVADWFIETEAERRALGTPEAPEQKGRITLTGLDFTLTAKADRFDRTADGAVLIYDYKTGTPPTKPQQKLFDKQLLLEAAMVERGGFEGLGPSTVAGASYIGLGSKPGVVDAPLDDPGIGQVWEQFHDLIGAYFSPDRGYTARRYLEKERFTGDYDHLSRFGEWDETDTPEPEDMP